MDKSIEDRLKAQIFDFKTRVWEEALEDVNAYIEPTDIKLFDYYAAYRITVELLKKNEPFFRLTFFFRMYPPNPRLHDGLVMPSISLHMGNMEEPGLEKRFKELDKEITLITAAEIADMVKSLIRTYGGMV
jgi:hypothetical protein